LNPDTDGDGLRDGEELNMYRTDPLKADTDAGSVDDFTEITEELIHLILMMMSLRWTFQLFLKE